MTAVDKAKYMLTLCYKCIGCNKLEDEEFKCTKECKHFRRYK